MKKVIEATALGKKYSITMWTNKRGELHRWFGPAFTNEEGLKIWYRNGKTHRRWGPAYISDGYKEWYRNGKLIKSNES